MEKKTGYRLFLSLFFFLSGFIFSSWASRIPTIKAQFSLNDAELGSILLFMPISSLIGLPISGWLVSRYDSRIPLTIAFNLNAISLAFIGYAESMVSLILSICVFAFSMRILNIAINTQGITVQKHFEKKIVGSFHGLWSTGGIAGIAYSTVMVALNVNMQYHFLSVAAFTLTCTLLFYSNLMAGDRSPSGNKLVLGKPDPYIFYLGLLVFFAAVCEGGMFDWSVIYFKEVVGVNIFTSGYLIFMTFMAFSRFLSAGIIESLGMAKTYIMSAGFIVLGIALAVTFPSFWAGMVGFSLVGFGTAAVIPMTYSLAGASKKYSPGMAISIIATYGISGMLLGPPLIGYISHAFNLRIAFITFGIAGIMLIPISQTFFRHRRKEKETAESLSSRL